MELNEDVITKSTDIDYSPIDKSDRAYVRSIMIGVLRFCKIMPPINVKFISTPHHYNTIITGWNGEIDDKLWYQTFLGNERNDKMSYILGTSSVPSGINEINKRK